MTPQIAGTSVRRPHCLSGPDACREIWRNHGSSRFRLPDGHRSSHTQSAASSLRCRALLQTEQLLDGVLAKGSGMYNVNVCLNQRPTEQLDFVRDYSTTYSHEIGCGTTKPTRSGGQHLIKSVSHYEVRVRHLIYYHLVNRVHSPKDDGPMRIMC